MAKPALGRIGVPAVSPKRRSAKRSKKRSKSPRTRKGSKSDDASSVDGASSSLTNHELYRVCSNPPVPEHLFGITDLVSRLSLSIGLVYYLMITRPISYFMYTLHYNMAWYYAVPGAIMTVLFFPFMPFFLSVVVIVQMIKDMFSTSWMHDSAGATFFARPKGPIAIFLWEWWLNLSMYSSTYLLTGHNRQGVLHSVYDLVTTKEFWFAKGKMFGARFPRVLLRWDGRSLLIDHDMPRGTRVIFKLENSYLGIGDMIFHRRGDDDSDKEDAGVIYFDDYDELRAILGNAEGYKGCKAFATEFLLPPKSLGVHQSDVLTICPPGGSARVVRNLFWGDCTEKTSHSATSVYFIDCDQEKIAQPARWYSPSFKNSPEDKVGISVPGTKHAIDVACRMQQHIAEELPWCRAIGWDIMCTNDKSGEQVFFEGNFAGSRLRRHCFNSIGATVEFAKLMAPVKVFGKTLWGY